jgi:hypothetical protein
MNTHILPASALRVRRWLFALVCIACAPSTTAQTESRSVVIVEHDGRYIESTRHDPAPGTKQYWADIRIGAIRRSAIDGSGVEDLATALDTPYGIAFDPKSQVLLWTSAGDGVVQKIPPWGGYPMMLPSAFEPPFAIDVSDEAEREYYSVIDNVVYQTLIDNETGLETMTPLAIIVDDDPAHGLAFDPEAHVLYVGDTNGRMTRRIDLVGSDIERLTYVDLEPVPPGGGGTTDPVMFER